MIVDFFSPCHIDRNKKHSYTHKKKFLWINFLKNFDLISFAQATFPIRINQISESQIRIIANKINCTKLESFFFLKLFQKTLFFLFFFQCRADLVAAADLRTERHQGKAPWGGRPKGSLIQAANKQHSQQLLYIWKLTR